MTRVIREVRYVKDRYPLKNVHFSDDTFVLDKEWLKEFLAAYRREISLPFSCNIRIDQVNAEMIRDLAESGCYGISFGIESGSDRIRNEILKKNLKEEDIIHNSKIIKRHGIKMIVTNLMGVPEETLEDAFKTVAINQKIGADYTRAGVLIPYPKTEIVDYAIERGLLPADYAIHNFTQIIRKSLIRSRYAREFENLCALFNLTVHFPFLTPLTRILIKLPLTRLYSLTRLWEAFENMLYFRLFNLAGFRYFFHIVKECEKRCLEIKELTSEADAYTREEVTCNLCKVSDEEFLFFSPERIVRCRRCGLIYCNPRLDAASLEKIYSKDYFVLDEQKSGIDYKAYANYIGRRTGHHPLDDQADEKG